MNAEDKEYIDTKPLGKTHVVHVDMSQRMRQNSKPMQQRVLQTEEDDIYVLLQQIQDKRDSIYMENEAERGNVIKRMPNMEDDDEERIPAFKRRFVQEIEEPSMQEKQEEFNWDTEAYWDPPEHEEISNLQRQEFPTQPFSHDPTTANTQIYNEQMHRGAIEVDSNDKEDYIATTLNAVMDTEMHERESRKHYIDDLQMEDEEVSVAKQELEEPWKEYKTESNKFIFYTILILIVDILLILLLHRKGSFFGESDLTDMTRYFCIFIKYAVIVHLFVTLYSAYKDKKGKE